MITMKWNSETTEKLTKNEKKLIDFIFQNIHQFSSMSIQELSQKTHISQATISRLPKHLGYLNFKDLLKEQRFVLLIYSHFDYADFKRKLLSCLQVVQRFLNVFQ